MRESEHTDIWVIDLRQEAHLGRCHGVFLRQKELQLKLSSFYKRLRYASNQDRFEPLTFEWATLWTLYYHIKVSQIVIMRLS